MSNANGTLYVRNVAQQALFELELQGQISDGHWENATPYDHWKPWCNCTVQVAHGTKQPVGRTFYARRTRYAFANPSLLDIVGRRMLSHVRLAKVFGIRAAREIEKTLNLDGTALGTSDWFQGEEVQKTVRKHGADAITEAINDESLYSMADLKRDLKDLSAIVQQRVEE